MDDGRVGRKQRAARPDIFVEREKENTSEARRADTKPTIGVKV